MPPRLELLLADHGTENITATQTLSSVVEKHLQNTTEPVYVLLENADPNFSAMQRSNMEQFSEQGIRPAIAYAFSSIEPTEVTVAILKKRNNLERPIIQEMLRTVIDDVATFNDITALDDLNEQYKDEKGNSRVKLLFEPFTPIVSVGTQEAEILDYMMETDFDTALQIFKTFVNTIAQDATTREKAIAEKIATYTDRGIVVGLFGTGHTGIEHQVRTKMPVKKYFVDADQGDRTFRFDPTTALIRKIHMKGQTAVTDVEWNRALIGFAMYRLFQALDQEGTIKDQQLIAMIYVSLKKFRTLDDVNEFFATAKRDGLLEALQQI